MAAGRTSVASVTVPASAASDAADTRSASPACCDAAASVSVSVARPVERGKRISCNSDTPNDANTIAFVSAACFESRNWHSLKPISISILVDGTRKKSSRLTISAVAARMITVGQRFGFGFGAVFSANSANRASRSNCSTCSLVTLSGVCAAFSLSFFASLYSNVRRFCIIIKENPASTPKWGRGEIFVNWRRRIP